MRITKKKQIVKALEALEKAQNQLKDTNIERVQMLTNMQEVAIEIGTELEKYLVPESLIHNLEKYCELLYQMSIENDESLEWQKLYLDLKKNLEVTKIEIEKIPTEKLEVVFLPYNASMWDSFDSVYQECVKDNNVNVSVVPIPYYNKDNSGKFSVYNYDGALFPKEIPITNYKEYNIPEKKPDVIFIHAPYDKFNNLTRIEETYYSSELCKYTEHLVYIPYYIADNKIDELQCIMPGIRNAWRVYVQSDVVKNQIISARVSGEEKVKAFGSPKIDMVVKQAEKKTEVPQEWKSALENKKVFLIATTCVSVLNNPKGVLNKINRIVDIFENDNSIAFIFRPHPLTEKTLRDKGEMEEFQKLITRIEHMENGVFDDSSDNQRAIALSDAYIGERSSMLTLYRASGKPIYILEWQVDYYEGERKLEAIRAGIYNNKLWMFHRRINALFSVDMNTWETEYVLSIENEPKYQEGLFSNIEFYQDKMFLMAGSAECDVIVDLKTMKQEKLPKYRMNSIYGVKNTDTILDEDKIHILPKFYGDNIKVYNFKKKVYSEINIDYSVMENYNVDKSKFFWTKGYKDKYGYWLCSVNVSGIFHVGMDGKTQIYMADTRNQGFQFLTCLKNSIYLLPRGGKEIMKFQVEEKKFKEILVKEEIYAERDTMLYSSIIVQEEKMYFVPLEAKYLKIYNIKNEKMISYNVGANKYLDFKIYGNKIYLIPYNGRTVILIDLYTDEIAEKEVYIPKDCEKYWVNQIEDVNGERYLYSEHIYTQKKFVKTTVEQKVYKLETRKNLEKYVNNVDGSCGEKIWRDIIENL